MNKTSLLTILVLAFILVVCGIVTYVVYKNPNDGANSSAAKDLAVSETAVYTDLEGNPFTFEKYEGKVRVVNTWASWSPFSQQELKDMEKLAHEFERDGVIVIAVNRKEPKERAQSFLSTVGEFEKVVFAIDVTDAFYKSIKGYAMPETIFYNTRGDVVFHKRGEMAFDEMKQHTQEAIREAR